MNGPNSKYLVYSLDVLSSGETCAGEAEIQTLADILMWLSDDIDDDAKSKIAEVKPGETFIFTEGQHGNFQTRQIRFMKLWDCEPGQHTEPEWNVGRENDEHSG